jgi:hypothetical protein
MTIAFDCVQIPGAKNTAGAAILNNICGGKFATINADANTKTICCEFPYSHYVHIYLPIKCNSYLDICFDLLLMPLIFSKFVTTCDITTLALISLPFTVAATQQPFVVQFQSDSFTLSDAMVARKGFKLNYWQSTTC